MTIEPQQAARGSESIPARAGSAVLEVLSVGMGATLQDRGRFGWRCFGVPLGGAMDDHAAGCANRLLDNPLDAPVLELLLQGAKLRVLQEVWLALAGAHHISSLPLWRATHVPAGTVLEFSDAGSGVWTYLAVEGGFKAEPWLGSVSAYPRARLGHACAVGEILHHGGSRHFTLPPGVAGRCMASTERRDYEDPPALRIWPGPQWAQFDSNSRESFFRTKWTVTGQMDRTGYRLEGPPVKAAGGEIISEPVRVGSIQVPDNGQPLVTMRDGPTIGGYPKLGLIDGEDLSWLVQCHPGQTITFVPVNGDGPEL